MLLWILMMAAPVIIGRILKLRSQGCRHRRQAFGKEPTCGRRPTMPRQFVSSKRFRARTVELRVRHQISRLEGGPRGCCWRRPCLAGPDLELFGQPRGEIFMFLMFLWNGDCLPSASGRFSATGVRPSNWADAQVSTWRVTHPPDATRMRKVLPPRST